MPQEPNGWAQAEQYMSSGTGGASAAVDLGKGFEHIRIANLDDTDILYVDMKGGVASAADFGIPPNTIYYYDGPMIQNIRVFSSGTPPYSIHAF